MGERRLRPGMDRHDVATEVAELLLSDQGLPAGLSDHGPIGKALRVGRSVDHALDDPFDNGRRIVGQCTRQADGSLLQASLMFRSSDKMDVDSAYQALRKALRTHGSPTREQGSHLVFTWTVPGGTTSLSRYRDDDGTAVLRIQLKGRG